MRDVTDVMIALLITFATIAVVLIFLVGCWRRWDKYAKIPCYWCGEIVGGRLWDQHRTDCTRVYARHIEALPELKLPCGRCEDRKLRRFAAPVGFRFPCADPICRLSNGVTPVVDAPEERYICFECDFNFCAGCVNSYYRDPGDPAALAAIPAIQTQLPVISAEEGDQQPRRGEDEDLPPDYENVEFRDTRGIGELPPSYDECVKVLIRDIA